MDNAILKGKLILFLQKANVRELCCCNHLVAVYQPLLVLLEDVFSSRHIWDDFISYKDQYLVAHIYS